MESFCIFDFQNTHVEKAGQELNSHFTDQQVKTLRIQFCYLVIELATVKSQVL